MLLAVTQASPFLAFMILYGTLSISFFTKLSSNFRPIRRLIANNVFSGLLTACLFADCPTKDLSSSLVYATMEGVVLSPSLFSITFAWSPSIMATHEFVVPKSIPITLDIVYSKKVFS